MSSLSHTGEISGAPLDMMTVITGRRSIGAVLPDMPPRVAIETMLEAATYAPNHHRTEPWSFHVLSGDARRHLGEIAAASMEARGEAEKAVTKARGSFLRAPVVIVVTAAPGRDAIETVENRDAVCAAIENMLLASTSLGLATIWRTGRLVSEPAIKTAIGLAPGEEIVGFVYVGYPAIQPLPRVRQSTTACTQWWGDDANFSEQGA